MTLKRLFDFVMWLPFKKSILESDLLSGMTDFHSHILPGVDDGVETLAEAIRILQQYEAWGIREVWFTPHIMEDYPNSTDLLHQQFSKTSEAYFKVAGSYPINLHLSAEYMIDSLFVKRLKHNDLLPIVDKHHLLVETSYYTSPFGFEDILSHIMDKGYIPVLAHPERYHYMTMDDYHTLWDKGVKLQLNLTSITGTYGEEVQKKSFALLKQGLYTLTGSDLHRLETFYKGVDELVNKSIIQLLHSTIYR